jgi:hypothetical protein
MRFRLFPAWRDSVPFALPGAGLTALFAFNKG